MAARDFWVFGYGSLIWRPGFGYLEQRRARIFGHHRAMCIYSHLYRGTAARPGLVAGLIPGGSCCGIAFRVAGGKRHAVIGYLHGREMIDDVYVPTWLNARIGPRRVRALAYVANRRSDRFAGERPLAEAATVINGARGSEGTGREYVENIVAHLDDIGIPDGTLHRLLALMGKGKEG